MCKIFNIVQISDLVKIRTCSVLKHFGFLRNLRISIAESYIVEKKIISKTFEVDYFCLSQAGNVLRKADMVVRDCSTSFINVFVKNTYLYI